MHYLNGVANVDNKKNEIKDNSEMLMQVLDFRFRYCLLVPLSLKKK
jgi:hypothetical protein